MISAASSQRVGFTAPGPRGRRLLGNLREVRKDRLGFVLRMQREYGDAICFRMGRGRQLFLFSHPDHFRRVLHENPSNYHKGLGLSHARPLLGSGLLTSEGELWARQRRLLQPAFERHRLPGYGESMVEAARTMAERCRTGSGTVVLARETGRLALDVLQRTVLRAPLLGVAEKLIADLDTLSHWSMRRMAALVDLPLAIPTPGNWRARHALKSLGAWARELIAERRAARPDGAPEDVLDFLLAASPALDDEQLRDELLTLLVTGYETTASVLAWTLYLLARYPETQRAVQEELDTVLRGQSASVEEISRLGLCRQVISESLRLYPPVWLIPRQALADDLVAGYEIPAGSQVLLSIASLHRNPRFWRQPETFRPRRFAVEGEELRLAGPAYLPFGSGPRACLGRFFGKMEILLVLATLGQRLSWREVPGPAPPPEPLLSLRPGPGLRIEAHAR